MTTTASKPEDNSRVTVQDIESVVNLIEHLKTARAAQRNTAYFAQIQDQIIECEKVHLTLMIRLQAQDRPSR